MKVKTCRVLLRSRSIFNLNCVFVISVNIIVLLCKAVAVRPFYHLLSIEHLASCRLGNF